ncbi:hypothetical protein MANES_18G137860v8 [Manihot esculenta]|uniref:Uncharacterized protein n=1 Tax=Manihot esculenta TaxID=3983 RepID=A0ACB7G1A7_MANES|nr:hypothetical protein MANES_18G137860v8 [Manihot esculenta]
MERTKLLCSNHLTSESYEFCLYCATHAATPAMADCEDIIAPLLTPPLLHIITPHRNHHSPWQSAAPHLHCTSVLYLQYSSLVHCSSLSLSFSYFFYFFIH